MGRSLVSHREESWIISRQSCLTQRGVSHRDASCLTQRGVMSHVSHRIKPNRRHHSATTSQGHGAHACVMCRIETSHVPMQHMTQSSCMSLFPHIGLYVGLFLHTHVSSEKALFLCRTFCRMSSVSQPDKT